MWLLVDWWIFPALQPFIRAMILVTIINLVALAMDHYRISDAWLQAIEIINLVCTIIFIVEV